VDELTQHRVAAPGLTATQLYALLQLRSEVFVVEQACSYLDPDGRDLEAGTIHLWLAAADGTVAAYVRVLHEPGGGRRIGRVVTAPSRRGRGLAGRLIDDVLAWAEAPVVLDAQSHLVTVYQRHGFVADGAEFVEDGIPHTPMRFDARS